MSKCKYYLEKEVVSYDGGITWNETGVTRKGNLYEESSEDCTDPSVQYRWINMNISTDWICDETNKYYKQKKQVSYDGLIWQDVTPAEYQRGSIYEVNSPDCQPTYRWVNLDIATDWICDETTYTKYYKQKKQVSYGGQEWQDVIPYEYQRGDVYETESTDCGYVPPTPQYRWVNMDIATDYICEYVPGKFKATYSGGQTYEKECDENTTLTTGDTKPEGYEFSGMTTAIIGNCVTEIGAQAFESGRSLTSIDIPNSVTSIGDRAFRNCSGLTSCTIGSGVTSIGGSTFRNCFSLTSVTIPNSVTSIGSGAFDSCSSLTGVTIPNSVTWIGEYIFEYCSNLTTAIIGNGVTRISGYAFRSCRSLASIDIPSGVTDIGSSAFAGCSSLTSMTVDSNNTVYDSRNNCNGIINTSTNTLIVGCKNTVIPDSVTSIGANAFYGCSGITSIDIPDSVTLIDIYAFAYCSGLTSIDIPGSVTSIGNYTFSNCSSLTSIDIPSGVTSIGQYTFYQCSSLTSITIPDGVTSIGNGAFNSCSGLTSITVNATTPPTLGNAYAFTNTNNCPIYVPASSVETYKSASGWSTYADRIQAIP